MDTRTLRYFIAAAETENLSRASERMNVVQSTLSHQIRRLETDLGAALFVRRGRRIELSELGRLFLEDARAIVDAVDSATRRAAQAASGELGELRIGFETNASVSSVMSETLLAFRERYPDVKVQLVSVSSGRILDALATAELDACFAYLPEIPAELDSLTYKRSDWLLTLPRNHHLEARERLALSDLEGEAFIWRPRPVSPAIYDAMIAACRAGGLQPRIVQEAYNEPMMINLAASGLGICFVIEDPTLGRFEHKVAFRRVDDFTLPLELRLVWRRDNATLCLPHLISIARMSATPDAGS